MYPVRPDKEIDDCAHLERTLGSILVKRKSPSTARFPARAGAHSTRFLSERTKELTSVRTRARTGLRFGPQARKTTERALRGCRRGVSPGPGHRRATHKPETRATGQKPAARRRAPFRTKRLRD